MARHKNANWSLHDPAGSWNEAHIAVLMDIRDELQALNRIIGCANFLAIPMILRDISSNTKKPKLKKRLVAKKKP